MPANIVSSSPNPMVASAVGISDDNAPPTLEGLSSYVAGVNSSDATLQLLGCRKIRKLLSGDDFSPRVQPVIDSGVLVRLASFLSDDARPDLQLECAWALTNVASGTSAQTQVVAGLGAIPAFVRLLQSPDREIREQAVWGLGNLAGDSPELRDAVLAVGAMPVLLSCMNEDGVRHQFRTTGIWALSNMCRGKPEPNFAVVGACIPTLAAILREALTDPSPPLAFDLLPDALWTISYLSSGSPSSVSAVASGIPVPLLVSALSPPPGSSASKIQTPALRCVGNLAAGSASDTDSVVSAGGVPALLALLSSDKKALRKEAAWALSNVAAGTRDQIQALVEGGGGTVLRKMRELLESDGEGDDVKKECAFALAHVLSGGTNEQAKAAADEGCLRPLCVVGKRSGSWAVCAQHTKDGIKRALSAGIEMSKEESPERDIFLTIVDWAMSFMTMLDAKMLEQETITAMKALLDCMKESLHNLVEREPHLLLVQNERGFTLLDQFRALAAGPFSPFLSECSEITKYLEEMTNNAGIVKKGLPDTFCSKRFESTFIMLLDIC